MPIYEYACKDCNNQFETLVRSDTVPECPKCQSIQLEKLLSVFATTASAPDAPSHFPSTCGGCPNMGVPGACSVH